MIHSSDSQSTSKKTFVALACTALLGACGASQSKCEVYGLDIGTRIDTNAKQISIVDGGGDGNLLLYAAGGRTKQWHEIDAQGVLGPALGRATTDDVRSFLTGWTHHVLAWNTGFRVIRDRTVEYVVADQPVTVRSYTSAGPPLPAFFKVEVSAWIDGEIYVIWSAKESAGPPATHIAGLGRLDSEDRVTAIGEPFLRTSMMPNTADFFVPGGGWDPQLRHFFVDHPDREQVHEVALDGTLIGRYAIVGDAPYLRNWLKLPDGHFVGQHASNWLRFTPTERFADPQRRGIVPANTISSSTQLLDRDKSVWIAGTASQQLHIRRYDVARATLSEGTVSPLTVQDCDVLLAID
jgi:hypothetical protein